MTGKIESMDIMTANCDETAHYCPKCNVPMTEKYIEGEYMSYIIEYCHVCGYSEWEWERF